MKKSKVLSALLIGSMVVGSMVVTTACDNDDSEEVIELTEEEKLARAQASYTPFLQEVSTAYDNLYNNLYESKLQLEYGWYENDNGGHFTYNVYIQEDSPTFYVTSNYRTPYESHGAEKPYLRISGTGDIDKAVFNENGTFQYVATGDNINELGLEHDYKFITKESMAQFKTRLDSTVKYALYKGWLIELETNTWTKYGNIDDTQEFIQYYKRYEDVGKGYYAFYRKNIYDYQTGKGRIEFYLDPKDYHNNSEMYDETFFNFEVISTTYVVIPDLVNNYGQD